MKKTLLIIPIIALLFGCSSVEQNKVNKEETISQVSTYWTPILVTHKIALRSCIVANKDINSILYLKDDSEKTQLTAKTNRDTILDCYVDNKTNQVVKIQPRTESLPTNLDKFYPIGKKIPDGCRNIRNLHDEQGRLMGTVCR